MDTISDMRLFVFLILLCSSIGAYAVTFSVSGADVSFDAPDGFSQLSKDEIALKFPSNRAPSDVVGNGRRTTTIAFELKQDKLAPEQLPEVKEAFERLFERIIPGLDWRERKIVQLHGQTWVQFELSSRAVDTDIHNVMLITSRYGRMLIFNFNSTKAEFPAVESALRKSIQSIEFKRNSAAK